MFYAFCHNWSIVLCETKSKLFPARIPNYQAIFRKVWILYKFGFVEKSKLLDFSTMLVFWSLVLLFGIVWCWRSISCFQLLASLPYMSTRPRLPALLWLPGQSFHRVKGSDSLCESTSISLCRSCNVLRI